MNLFYNLTVVCTLLILELNDGRVNCTSDDSLSIHPRTKRLFNGTETANDAFPYIVFLKSLLRDNENAKDKCQERLCTGTLIHERFVLTTKYCVYPKHDASDVSEFFQCRF